MTWSRKGTQFAITAAFFFILGSFAALTYAAPQAFCFTAYRYVSPNIDCTTEYVIDKRSFLNLKESVIQKIDEETSKGTIRSASVYFRDLDHGPVFGINEYLPLFPTTLLTLTLITTYYDYAAQYPDIFVELVRDDASGESYTVRDLLTRLAQENDTAAYTLLRAHLHGQPGGEELLVERASELGLVVHPESGIEKSISVKAYTSMFHSLFFARFLPISVAEEVLSLMDDVERKGMAEAVPPTLRVVHRMGAPIRLFDTRLRVHDCGIVYFSDNPYSLCIAVEGVDEEKMRALIVEIARMVYAEVESRQK